MKKSNLFLITSLCGVAFLMGGCTMCHVSPKHHRNHEQQYNHEKPHQKHKQHKKHQSDDPAVFYQHYNPSDVIAVKANVYTRNSSGKESNIGTINFIETNNGLEMSVNLTDLRPGKTYTTLVYQCFECNDSTCCSEEAMSIDLPKIETKTAGRLQESYIIRGLTATQLNNAKIVLTRDGGYKAAWGTLLN